ncbi:hypothetical protein [Sphingopyxis yananensis]|uniref:hypothetical protein n=1 Tax=Sphingopyxis yananensis TaxID=2886687 RepID=UPI001D126D08|nr:hypothetical protein [Sphingopyxis yananensis]MCC2602370.1 hypothetical protein [Sphingopyxis yananensis]
MTKALIGMRARASLSLQTHDLFGGLRIVLAVSKYGIPYPQSLDWWSARRMSEREGLDITDICPQQQGHSGIVDTATPLWPSSRGEATFSSLRASAMLPSRVKLASKP